jgi:hypothetical protein
MLNDIDALPPTTITKPESPIVNVASPQVDNNVEVNVNVEPGSVSTEVNTNGESYMDLEAGHGS